MIHSCINDILLTPATSKLILPILGAQCVLSNLDVGFFCIKIYPYNNQQYEGYCSWYTTYILRPTKMFWLKLFSVEICFYINGGWINTNGVLFIFISQLYKVIHSYYDLQKKLCERRDEFGPPQIIFYYKYYNLSTHFINKTR